MKIQQTALKHAVRAAGIGLHTGEPVTIRIRPANAGTGICFIRRDVDPTMIIPARAAFVVDTRFATTIGAEHASISTIEHLMAAFSGLGIDNAIVEIDGPEVPAMDGSAAPFMGLMLDAGTRKLQRTRKYMKILEPISVASRGSYIKIEPCSTYSINFKIEFDHHVIARQRYELEVTVDNFVKSIGIARTFGFLREVQMMRDNGLALGGSLDNAIVIDDNAVLNSEGLRFSDEFVRHKILDLIGDLALAGMPILGRVTAVKSGHALHHELVTMLLSRPDAWKVVEVSEAGCEPERRSVFRHARAAVNY